MIKFLRNNQRVLIFLIFLYGALVVFLTYFIHLSPDSFSTPFAMPFFMDVFMNQSMNGNLSLLWAFFVYLGLIFSGFYLVRNEINSQLISKRSQFSALFLIAICSFCFPEEMFSGAIIAAIFLLLGLGRVIGSIDQKGLSYRFLEAGILLALGSLFYINLIFLLPFLWISQWMLRPSNWRELLFTIMGIILPLIYILSGAFILNIPIGKTFSGIAEWIVMKKVIELNQANFVGIFFFLVIMLIGSLFVVQKFTAAKIQTRKLYQLQFFLFLNILGVMLLVPSAGLEIMYFMAIPVGVLLSIYFTECRNSFLNRFIFFALLIIPLVLLIY